MGAFRFAAIGDSLTQGFQNGAIAKTAWSFPAIIARAAGLSVGSTADADFRVPEIPGDGLPLNLEKALDAMAKQTGAEVSVLEWFSKGLPAFERYVDGIEEFYERGVGSAPNHFAGVYHNLAVFGHTVFEATHVNSHIAGHIVRREEGWREDDVLGLPSAAEERVAQRVLNPSGSALRAHATQLDNLNWLVNGNRELDIAAEPLDALCVWLGANDCLETVITLELRDMPESAVAPEDVLGRRRFNLTSVRQFEADFRELAARVDRSLAGKPTKVFVGTVPDVTIPPITTGLGRIDGEGLFPHYARFVVPPEHAERASPLFYKTLRRDAVRTIQRRIGEFNRIIRDVALRSGWIVVDTAAVLGKLAVRRNAAEHDPGSRLRAYYAARPDHPLLGLDPTPSLQPFATDHAERRTAGGLTSLDFVHPTTIGYGIVAEAFLEAMNGAGIAKGARLPWEEVIRADTLLSSPPKTWNDVRAQSGALGPLWDLIARALIRPGAA